MKKLGVGIIGCGRFALSHHVPNCRASGLVELRHCADSSGEGRAAARRAGAARVSGDYRELLADPLVDLVILSVPHAGHMPCTRDILRAGKHLLCEKPMTMSMGESYEVARLAREAGVMVCVDYNRRFSPAMIDLKREFSARRESAAATRVPEGEPGRRRLAEEGRTMVLFRVNDESATYRGIHLDWHEGGGEVIGESCHWFDLMAWLLEERPVRVFAAGGTRLDHVASIEFDGGSLGCLFFSASGTFEYPKELFEIQCRGNLLRSECFVENQYFGRGEPETRQFAFTRPGGKSGRGLSAYLADLVGAARGFRETGRYLPPAPDKGHRDLLESFAGAIISGRPSPVDETAGMRATYLCLRAADSIRSGQPVPVNIEDWDMFVQP